MAFPAYAQEVVDRFGLVVDEKIDGLDERLWIARKDQHVLHLLAYLDP